MQKILKKQRSNFPKFPDEEVSDAQKKIDISFVCVVVDVCITSLQERCLTLDKVQETFASTCHLP